MEILYMGKTDNPTGGIPENPVEFDRNKGLSSMFGDDYLSTTILAPFGYGYIMAYRKNLIDPSEPLWFPWLNNSYHTVDPLALDLDGDGIETTGVNGYATMFDHNNNGIETATGWISKDDGLLVYDKNNDGIINNGNELFGDNYILANGELAKNGYEALAEFDTNGDGIVDINDANFNRLQIWRDLNEDGISQQGELFTLNELGIKSLNLSYNEVNKSLGNGNELIQKRIRRANKPYLQKNYANIKH